MNFEFKPLRSTTTVAPTSNMFSNLSTKAPLQFGTETTRTATPATVPPKLSQQTNVTTGSSQLSFGTTSTSALNFGTATSFSFGSNTASSVPATFATSTNLKPLPLSSDVTTSSTTVVSNVGLGGIPTSDSNTATIISVHKEVSPKDQPLPNEILQTVDSFKAFVKKNRSYSSDISRCSAKEYQKVECDMNVLISTLNDIEYELYKNRKMTEKLKYDTAKGLQYIEMAQRTQDTPPGLQYDNVTPTQFFIELTDNFEKEMHTLKIQLEAVDKWIKNSQNPTSITPDDISLGMKRLHETFVALAGRFQVIHSRMETQKEQLLNLRKNILNDYTNIFERSSDDKKSGEVYNYINSVPSMPAGPTPFSTMAKSQAYLLTQPAAVGIASVGSTQDHFANNPSFGLVNLGFSTSSQPLLQLNKPPVGNKRGKV